MLLIYLYILTVSRDTVRLGLIPDGTIRASDAVRNGIWLSLMQHKLCHFTLLYTLLMCRLGLAIVPLCRGTGAPFDEHRRPLAPSKFFLDNNGNNFS